MNKGNKVSDPKVTGGSDMEPQAHKEQFSDEVLMRRLKRTIIWMTIALVIIGLMFFKIVSMTHELAENENNYAYQITVLIDLYEDNLFLKYGYRPSQVGLKEVEDTWHENPCKETAEAYLDALKAVLDYLNGEDDETETKPPNGGIIAEGPVHSV